MLRSESGDGNVVVPRVADDAQLAQVIGDGDGGAPAGFKALQLEVDEVGSIVDGSVVRAHQDASGGKGGSRAMPSAVLAGVFRPNSTLSSTRRAAPSTSRSRRGSGTR